MAEGAVTRFRSEIGWPFLLIYGVLVWRIGWPLVRAVLRGQEVSVGLMVAAIATLGLPAYVAATTVYEITEDALVVRCGPVRTAIALGAIRTLRASRSLLASPALSLNRIEVLASPGPYVLISPVDRPAFLRELLARAPHIKLDGVPQP